MKVKDRVISFLLFFLVFGGLAIVSPGRNCTVEAKAVRVYYAQYSKKYHCTKRCRTLARSRKIYKTTKKNARRYKRLTACKVCH